MFCSCASPIGPLLLSLLFLLLFCRSFAQLFLPSSHLPSALSSSSKRPSSSSNDCACSSSSSSSSKFHRQPLPTAETFHQKMMEQQMEEAKKVKALVNMLNVNVRRKPIKTVTKVEGIPSEMGSENLELMVMKAKELQKMRGQGQMEKTKANSKKEKEKAKREKSEKDREKKRKKAVAKSVQKQRAEAEQRRAKRKSDDPWGEEGPNSVIEEPLTPPEDDERDGTTTGRCNSERIRKVIKRAKGRDASAIKRNIQTVAERQFEAKFNVICANADFSYISNTDEFCQEQINGNTCYVFRQLERSHKFTAEADDGHSAEEDDGGGEEEQFARRISAMGRGRKRKRN